MSCFMCYQTTGMGCQYCRDQLSDWSSFIHCDHLGSEETCDQCQYENMRNMTGEEIIQAEVNPRSKPQKFTCSIYELTEAQNKEFIEETLERLAQGVQDYNDGKIIEREWRKPSLWKKIKGMFK